MKQPSTTMTWPPRSDGAPRFTALPLPHTNNNSRPDDELHLKIFSTATSTSSDGGCGFSSLPYELVAKIGAGLNHRNLRTASLVCRSWCDALRPLRAAMLYMRWGKQFKHGRGGFLRSKENALNMFLKAARYGSTMALVDAGLVYWETGHKDKAVAMYLKAAELGDTTGRCNLGISYLQVEPPNPKEAVKWLYLASYEGHVRAQYQLAICLHHGRGVDCNMKEAARWYLRAAEGGYVRAMYNVSVCYSHGEGLVHSRRRARKWMMAAADRGHSKAQYEHGLTLFSEGDMLKALVYLELATRAGESAARHIKDVVFQQLSQPSRNRAMSYINNWRPLPSLP